MINTMINNLTDPAVASDLNIYLRQAEDCGKTETGINLAKTTPTEPGFYWFTNFGEHTPCILEVVRDTEGSLCAFNEDFIFALEDAGESCLWGKIPNPIVNGKMVEPNSY